MSFIPVQEILYATIQGEGFYSGSVADFLRLYGCPVGCYFCDTGYAKGDSPPKFTTLNYEEIELDSNFVVITGGEPFIHNKLPSLCRYLLKKRKFVTIETSGSFWKPIPENVWITLSPKEHLNKKMKILPEIWKRADEVKMIYTKDDDINFYRDKYPNKLRKKILKYIQPEWDQSNINPDVMNNLLNYLRANPEYKLSLQTHKLIGIP